MEYTIDTFVTKLLQEKGITGLPEEVMDQMRNDLAQRAQRLIDAEILAHLPENQLETFEQLLDSGSEESLQLFCRQQIPNMDEVVAQALVTLQKTYLTDTLA